MPLSIPQTLVGELSRLNPSVNWNEIEEAALSENKDFGRVVIERGLLSDAELLDLKSKLYHIPAFSLETIEVDKSVGKEVTDDVSTFYQVVPFAKEGGILKVAILDPENVGALEALKFLGRNKGVEIEKYLISYKDFDSLTRQYRTLTGEVGEALESFTDELEKDTQKIEPQAIDKLTPDAPAKKIVAVIVRHAVESRASDIHIEPFDDRVRVRFRIDGVLINSLTLPKNLHSPIITRIKILSDLKIDETRLAQDGRFATKLNNRKIDFRVSTFPTKFGEKVVMRILDPMTGNITLEDLGLDGRSKELIEKAMAKPFGSILITGPTGSGKSTTLAAMLKMVNSEDVNIVTLEDPIEYYIDGVNQSQIHEEIGYTFASGLRYILRQDPDIIMVGEIRDRETAGLATQAALTGHIVFSTLHTNDALGVVPRLIDMGVEKYLIPPTLNIAAAQRLLRRLCPECKIKTQANSGEEKIISEAIKAMPKDYQKDLLSTSGYTIHKANEENPCKACGGKAYKGRIAIFEMIEMTEELEKIILTSISESAMKEEARRQGMINMFQDGIIKVLKGTVSLDELLEVAQSGDSA